MPWGTSHGFEVRNDIVRGEGLEGAGFRWLAVGPRGHPGIGNILAGCAMGRDRDAVLSLVSVRDDGNACRASFEVAAEDAPRATGGPRPAVAAALDLDALSG